MVDFVLSLNTPFVLVYSAKDGWLKNVQNHVSKCVGSGEISKQRWDFFTKHPVVLTF